jgi:hypothetical protein
MSGKADYRPAPGYEDKLHAVGPKLDPIWVGRAGDFATLFDGAFWQAFRAWERFNLGLSKPDPDSWLSDAVAYFEGQYRAHFSPQRAIIARLDALMGAFTARR